MRMASVLAAGLLAMAVTATGQTEKGLVLRYTFDEGAGEVVRDRSGHGIDGRIVPQPGTAGRPEWVQEGNRKVLRFGGEVHIEAGTKANDMIGSQGTLETWCFPEEITGGLISWHTGANWEDQRLVLGFCTYQDSRLIGVLANGIESTRSSWYPQVVEPGQWNHLVMTFDGTNILLYVNGKLCQTIPEQEKMKPNLKGVPLNVGRNVGLGGADFLGRMAEARIYNLPLSSDEVARHYADGVKRLGIKIPRVVGVTTRLDAKRGELTVLCDLALLPGLPDGAELIVALRDAKRNLIQEKNAPVPAKAAVVPVAFPTGSLTSGLYELSVSVKEAATNKALSEPATARWCLAEVGQLAGAPPGRKILNNMVIQLAAMENLPVKEYQEIPFVNPRKGWIFVSTTAQVAGRGAVVVAVDAEERETAIVRLSADKPAMETMRFLSAGEHKLCIWSQAEAGAAPPAVTRLIVRAVPAMMYCGWPGSSYVPGYGEYGFKFLERDVLPNINTLVGASLTLDEDRDEWKRRGMQYLQELGIPTLIAGVLKDVPVPITGDYAYNYWIHTAGFTRSNFDGVVNNEFGGGEDRNFVGYSEGVRRVAANPAFKDRALHMWGGPVMALSRLSREFVQTVIDCGYKLAWEDYLVESPTAEEALASFDVNFRGDMAIWEKAFPGFPRNAIMVLFISSAPPENANINPSVDYKVFLDMQYRHLATSPECFGLWGVMIYKATYADEEAIRWAGRLFRHYCIEGNTDLLSDRYGYTYNLRHIRNPDFDEGLAGWQSEPAEPDGIKTGHMYDLHGLLTRYHGNAEGNNFLLMKRSARKPNRVSQEIVGLKAGQCYSMKMLTADHRDFIQAKSEKKLLAVSASFENAEVMPAKSFVSEMKSYQPISQYAGKEPPWFNYHRLIFRATGPTARVTISDWADANTPGGPAGQETLVNFIEIQPYLEEGASWQ